MMLARIENNLKPIAPWVRQDDIGAPEASNNLGWYILLVEPNGERRSRDRLARYRIESYCPSYIKTGRQRGGRPVKKFLPMIPGYLFMAMAGLRDDAWKIIRDDISTIRSFLRDSERAPAVLSVNHMQDIMFMEARLNSPVPDEIQRHKFKIGDRVRYLGNIYWKWEGVVGAIAKDGKLGVDGILMFGQSTTCWVRPSEIEGCN